MFSNNTELVEKNIKKSVEDRLWVEEYIENHIKEQYDGFMHDFYKKLSERVSGDSGK